MAKRIIFTVTNDLTYDQRMNRIAGTLAAHGYEVTLVGRELPHSKPLEKQAYQQHRIKCHYQQGKLFYLEYNFKLWQWLRKQQFDLMGSVDHDTLLATYLVARSKNIPQVHDAHELFTEVPELQGRKLTQWLWRTLEKRLYPRMTVIYTVGAAIADYYASLYQRPVQVIRNMPKYRETSDPYQHPRPYILYQGALNMGRGLEAMLEAMQEIQGLDLLLIGEGDLSAALREQSVRLGIQDKVHFLGFLPPAQMWPYTCGAWLGLNVSENLGQSYFLSLNNKFFDYVQAGLPQLLNDFPEYRALNKDYQVGYLLQSDKREIIQAVQNLQQDIALYNSLKDNCRQAAAEWNWEKEATRLLAIYSKVFER